MMNPTPAGRGLPSLPVRKHVSFGPRIGVRPADVGIFLRVSMPCSLFFCPERVFPNVSE